jgi:hypothetical protein
MLATGAQPAPDRRLMMQLYAISGWPQMRAIKGISSGAAAWRETLALAVELDDVDYQLRAIWALWVDRGNNGQAVRPSPSPTALPSSRSALGIHRIG